VPNALKVDDGMGVLDARNHCTRSFDEMADVGVVVDVELYQQIVIARGVNRSRRRSRLGERVGDGIGLAELAFELDKKGTIAVVSTSIFRLSGIRLAARKCS